MRRTHIAALLTTLFLVVGCGSRPDRSETLCGSRILYLTPVISGGLSDRAFHLDSAVRSAATRSLTARGYQVGSEADAQAVVRIAWIMGRERSPSGQDERTLSLSLSIFSRSGERLYSARSNQVFAEPFWTEDRATAEVALLLKDLPNCLPAATPSEGKPALAPVRLQ